MEEMINSGREMDEMSKYDKYKTIVRLFAKAMFYGDWKWESPNERVIEMLMRDLGLLGFKDEDEMISETKINSELYQDAITLIPTRKSVEEKNSDESKCECVCEDEKGVGR